MFVETYGYNAWKFRPKDIKRRYEDTIAAIKDAEARYGVQGVVVCGTSGSWLAAALILGQELPVILVRKSSDSSHGESVEGNIFENNPRFLFVDDFVDTGSTLKHVKAAVEGRGGKVTCMFQHARPEQGVEPVLV